MTAFESFSWKWKAVALNALFATTMFLGAMPSADPVHEVGDVLNPRVMVVLPSGLHLRESPELLSPSMAVIPRGSLVCVLETERSWHRVRTRVGTDLKVGYMAQGFLGVPEVEPSPAIVRELCQ